MRLLTGSAMWVGALMLLGTTSGVAQNKKVEIGGFGGILVPTSDEGRENGTRAAQRRGSLAFGGRLTFWTSPRLGIELTGGYSPARVRVTGARGTFARSTDQTFGSGKLALNLTPGRSGLGFVLSGGVAAIRTGKTVADPDASTTDVGGVAGLSVRIPFFGALLRADVEDYLYSGDFGLGSKFTQDLLLSGGLSIRF